MSAHAAPRASTAGGFKPPWRRSRLGETGPRIAGAALQKTRWAWWKATPQGEKVEMCDERSAGSHGSGAGSGVPRASVRGAGGRSPTEIRVRWRGRRSAGRGRVSEINLRWGIPFLAVWSVCSCSDVGSAQSRGPALREPVRRAVGDTGFIQLQSRSFAQQPIARGTSDWLAQAAIPIDLIIKIALALRIAAETRLEGRRVQPGDR